MLWMGVEERTTDRAMSSSDPPSNSISLAQGGAHRLRPPATACDRGDNFCTCRVYQGTTHTSRHPQSLPPYNCALCQVVDGKTYHNCPLR